MGIINVKITDETEMAFRLELLKRKGSKKGAMGEAVDEALQIWAISIHPEAYERIKSRVGEKDVQSIPDVVRKIFSEWYTREFHSPI